MLLSLTLSAALLPGAPRPPGARYHGKALDASWQFSEEEATLGHSIKRYRGPFPVEAVFRPEALAWPAIRPKGRFAAAYLPVQRVRFSSEGKTLFALKAHAHTPFLVKGGVLYYADFSPQASGCVLVAFDLARGKQLWRTNLKGLGPVFHSGYRNRINLDLDGRALRVYGNETAGRYIEFVDRKTGKALGHKVFDGKK